MIFEQRYVEEELPFFMRVMERCAERDFPAPRPLHGRDGGFLSRARGKPACVVTWLTGVSPKTPNLAQCRAIGGGLARMHAALAGLEATRANGLGPQAWRPLITPRLALAEQLRPGLGALIETDMGAVETAWPLALPRGIIHADWFPDNALFLGNVLSGAIDFYFACEDFLAYDLAVCLNAWCFDAAHVYDLDKGEALIGAYEQVRRLTDEERAALPMLARGAALRFFATRLADLAEVPPGALVRPKDPLEYAAKLAFHRGARSARDYGG
jgi:homoserine kinase type II